jgi:hypothetical protein
MTGTPGFKAERTLYRTAHRYAARFRQRPGGTVTVALVDPNCFDNCYSDCNLDCFELTGSARGTCLRGCAELADACREACTVEPPTGGGGGGTPRPTCPSGGQCFTSGVGSACDCPPGESCRPRCGPQTCEVNALLCFLFPPVGCLPQCSPGLCTTDSFCQPG